MKISTRGRYALRLMIDLAKHQNNGNVSLKDVSKRQNISIKYLEQIVKPLTKNNLIKSIRGSHGGYKLTRSLQDYKIKEILMVLEGPIACVSCLENKPNQCPRFQNCPTVSFYEGLNQVINDYLDNYTLADLTNKL